MTTDRLYYRDSYLRRFAARVVERGEWEGQPAVALDRSAFYPEGGGQPGDHGTLNGVQVRDVQVRDGVVWHVLDGSLDADEVEGSLDWARRFDHMQQHSGQHILSAAFVEACGLATTSFHLGAETCTIDLDTTTLAPEQVAAAEQVANAIVWEDRPVEARFVSDEVLARLPLRKAPTVTGAVRIVSIPDFDYSPCGGTHPRSTGGVGMIAVRQWARQKNGTRLEFVCGGRALTEYRRINGASRRLATSLSVSPDQLEDTVERLRTAESAARRSLEAAQDTLLDHEAARLFDAAPAVGPARVVRLALSERSANELRGLAQRIAAQPGGVALLGLHGAKAQLVFARAAGLALDAGALLRVALPYVGGKGGGQAALAQGGGPDDAGLEAALAAAYESIATQSQASA